MTAGECGSLYGKWTVLLLLLPAPFMSCCGSLENGNPCNGGDVGSDAEVATDSDVDALTDAEDDVATTDGDADAEVDGSDFDVDALADAEDDAVTTDGDVDGDADESDSADVPADDGGTPAGIACGGDMDCSDVGRICNENWGICVVEDCAGQPDFTPCETITDPDRSYDICSNGACVSPGCGDAMCNAPGPHGPLADTSQRECYDTTGSIACPGTPGTAECETTPFCGQDAQYGWDVTHAASERFARSTGPEPIVTDNITGLMWTGCCDGRTGDTCTGYDAIYFWEDAVVLCDSLSWGGYADWRLPGEYELLSITDFGIDGRAIDPSIFPETPCCGFWSSSSVEPASSGRAWVLYVSSGWPMRMHTTGTFHVRCVRTVVADGPGDATRFVRTIPAGDDQPIVADAATGRVWQGCAAGQTGSGCAGSASVLDWQEAFAYCESSTWAGFTDWYLPNAIELWSITDNRRTSPAIDTAAFPGTPLSESPAYPTSPAFWSSSTRATGIHYSLVVGYVGGDMGSGNKRLDNYVRCVRVGP